jgi:hypothetical protein
MTALRHTLPLLEIRSQAQGLIEGYASVWGGVDSYGDSIVKGAFSASLTRHRQSGTAPVMLWSHRSDAPIGRWVDLAEDARGLKASGQLNLKTAGGREAFEHLNAGDLNGLSIGYQVPANGSQYADGINYLKQIELHEVSVVAIPADSAARISSVKSQPIKPVTVRGFEDALRELGFSRREAQNIAFKGFASMAESGDADPSHELISAIKAASNLFASKD